MSETLENSNPEVLDFIREKVAADLASGKFGRSVVTRFPPEPNGYLHIGHAKAICLDFGVAKENNGVCHLRMDDTNPTKEDTEYEESIINDVRWLGYDFGDHLYYASDYFERMYQCAEKLITKNLAYVCDLTPDEWKKCLGTLETPGTDSPGRARSIEENLRLFREMRAGKYEEGTMVLRARMDMASPNIHMRDPVIYRIRKVEHFRHGEEWCIYPMYDFAHPLEDAFENVTHSFCTLEFEIHRPLYEWVLKSLDFDRPPEQTEFSRLNLSYTVMSKRKLLQLVKEHYVAGWDDPRMPTICGLRRRGVPASAIRKFCKMVGVTKFDGITDIAVLEHCIREELNASAPRYLGVQHPLKVVITNYPAEGVEMLDAVNNPEDPSAGSRKLRFTKELYIEESDFMMDPPKGYFRLAPGREVRLRYGYFIKCEKVNTDAGGKVVSIECTYDPATRGGNAPDGRKVKGTIHWLSAEDAVPARIRLYDRLFTVEQPGADGADFLTQLNPDSITELDGFVEPAVAQLPAGSSMQLERIGYFVTDADGKIGSPVLNRTVSLKDSWNSKQKK